MSTEPAPGPLRARYGERSWELRPGRTYVAGRGGDVDLGTDPAMHRQVAAFEAVAGRWFVANLLKEKRLTVAGRDQGGAAPRVLGSSEDAELPAGRLRLSFRIGADLVHLDVDVPEPARDRAQLPSAAGVPTDLAGQRLDVNLPLQLRRLAVALAELRLLNPASTSPLPTRAEVRTRLGWSDKQYESNLDRLCQELARAGVEGVVGTGDAKAADRRERAVEALIDTGTISFADLDLLPAL